MRWRGGGRSIDERESAILVIEWVSRAGEVADTSWRLWRLIREPGALKEELYVLVVLPPSTSKERTGTRLEQFVSFASTATFIPQGRIACSLRATPRLRALLPHSPGLPGPL